MAALSRFICVKCEGEEIHRSVAGRILCCQCNTPWRPLNVAEATHFNARRVRLAGENADAMALQGAKNRHAVTYVRSTPLTCGHFECYTATGRCRECNLAWQWRRYHKLNPDSTLRGRSAARDAAIEAGAKTYVEGPCKNPLHGYAPPRYVSNRFCCQCAKESSAAQYVRAVAVA